MSLAQFKTDQSEVQSETPKLERAPLQEIQQATQSLRRYVPHHESCPDGTKEYYQDILQGGQNFHALSMKSELKTDEIESDLHGVLKQCESLWNQLELYKEGANQYKFDVKQYKVDLKRIEESAKTLKKSDKDLSLMQESLDTIKFDSDPAKHLGQELSEEDYRRYLKISDAEKESLERYEYIREQLRKTHEVLHDKELKKKESEEKVIQLTDTLAKLNDQIEETDALIHEKEKFIISCIDENEKLRAASNAEYASKLLDLTSKSEKLHEKVEGRRNKTNDDVNKLVSGLFRQLSQYSALKPFIHCILVIDQSGSMKKSRWNKVLPVLDTFARQNQSQDADLLSMITFDDTATEVLKRVKFSQYEPPSTIKWGGTNFDAAFAMARDMCNLSRNHRPVVIFLTDGEGIMKETPKILREMSALHKDRGFMLFSIGVGDDFNREALEEITRTANYGNLFLDFGSETIDFLHTTRDERVLDKIFTNISTALNILPHKIKAAIETLKKERIESDEEAQRQYEFNKKRSDQEKKDISERQQDLLQRNEKVLEKRKEEEKDQIKFFKKQKEDIQKEIKTLEVERSAASRLVTCEEIEALKEEKRKLEEQKVKAWDERQKLSLDRGLILGELEKSKSNANMATSLQLFDFLKAKDQAKSLKDNHQIYLGKMRNFIKPLIHASSDAAERFHNTTAALSDLEEDGIFDTLCEQYKEHVPIEKFQDSANFRNIACRVLEIKGTDSKALKILELLMDCLPPRVFVSPSTSDEDRKNVISSFIDGKYKFDCETLEEEYERVDEDWKKNTIKCELAQDDLRKLKTEIEELKEKKPKKEREVRKLKAKMSKSQRKDEADKENIRRNSNKEDEESDEDDEEKLETAMDKLQEIDDKIKEKKSKKKSLKENIKYLEEQVKELRFKKSEIDSQKSGKEREKEKMKSKVLSYNSRLKIELMGRVNKFVKKTNCLKIETFQKTMMGSLIKPISDYLTQI